MKKITKPPSTVDEYIASFPKEVQQRLNKIRKTIKAASPGAEEVLSYHMPAYKYHGMLVYFAAHTNHIGLYPYPSAMDAFDNELSKYKTSKSTVQFPNDKPIPFGLITKMVKFRIKENETKAALKAKSKK